MENRSRLREPGQGLTRTMGALSHGKACAQRTKTHGRCREEARVRGFSVRDRRAVRVQQERRSEGRDRWQRDFGDGQVPSGADRHLHSCRHVEENIR